jgi:hypothetical protein
MPFGLHTHFQGEESKYVTLFRDPVERIISHYEFVLRTPKHYLHDEVTSNNYTLLDYALSDLSIELDNHQCRSLVEGKSAAINEFSRELYEEALKNVEKHFISFGLVEEFDKSLILFRRDLKWEGYPYYVKFNVKPISAKKDISGEVRAKVAERNKWDQNLYQWAKREFALRMMGLPDLHNELNILRVASEAYKDGMDKGASVEREYLTRNRKGLKGRILNLLNR